MTGFPDPFAVATINGEQTKTTAVSKRTLNPYWNESFDLYAMNLPFTPILQTPHAPHCPCTNGPSARRTRMAS